MNRGRGGVLENERWLLRARGYDSCVGESPVGPWLRGPQTQS